MTDPARITVRRRVQRRRIVTAASVVGMCLVAACSSGGGAASTTEPPSTTEPSTTTEPVTTTEPTTTDAPPATTAAATSTSTTEAPTTTAAATTTTVPVIPRIPLTGEVLAAGTPGPDRSALVVKIDNVGAAVPQTGLNQADIVFEEIVEGRATRFAAVFHSQGANPVGPIRSGRTQDIDLLSGLNQPIFVWSGGNPGVQQVIEDSDFYSLNATGRPPATGFFRTGRSRPHNLYNNTDPLWVTLTWALGRPPPLFTYVEPGAAVPGEARSWLEVTMGTNDVRWDYDAASGRYLRQQRGRAHALTDGQASADNVVVLVTSYRPSAVDRRSPEAVTIGTGFAFVFSDGTYQEGTWRRDDNRSPIVLETNAGTPIDIAPGRTWVELADAVDHDLAYG